MAHCIVTIMLALNLSYNSLFCQGLLHKNPFCRIPKVSTAIAAYIAPEKKLQRQLLNHIMSCVIRTSTGFVSKQTSMLFYTIKWAGLML